MGVSDARALRTLCGILLGIGAGAACSSPPGETPTPPSAPTLFISADRAPLYLAGGLGSFEISADLTGETVTVHIGELALDTVVTTSSFNGNPPEFHVSVALPADARVHDGDLYVSYGAATSNTLPFLTAAWIDDVAPTEAYVGDLVTLSGGNFGDAPTGAQGSAFAALKGNGGGPLISWSDEEITFRMGPDVDLSTEIHVSKYGADPSVQQLLTTPVPLTPLPRAGAGCAVSAAERCVILAEVLGFSVDPAQPQLGGSVVIDGEAVERWAPYGWSTDQLSFYLPADLSIGSHEAVITRADGRQITTTVERLGFTHVELGGMPIDDDIGSMPTSEGATLGDPEGVYTTYSAFNARWDGEDLGYHAWGGHPQLYGLGAPTTDSLPPSALTPLPLKAPPPWPDAGTYYTDYLCATPRVNRFLDFLLFTEIDGATPFTDEATGRTCAGGPRDVRVTAFWSGGAQNVIQIGVDSEQAGVAGLVEAADRLFLGVVDEIAGTTWPYMIAPGYIAPDRVPIFALHEDHLQTPLPADGTWYQASATRFYIAGGDPGWDGHLWAVDVQAGVNQGAFPDLTAAEIPAPVALSAPLTDRILAFTGADDGALYAGITTDEGASLIYQWGEGSDAWTEVGAAPEGALADLATSGTSLFALSYLSERRGLMLFKREAGGWTPQGGEIGQWFGRWVSCQGPFEDAGPTAGQSGCASDSRPRDHLTWRHRPGEIDHARVTADAHGLFVTYDVRYDDSIYDGDVGEDRQVIAIWTP